MKLVAAHVHTPNLLLLRGISSQHIHHELSHCPSSNLWSVDLTFTSGLRLFPRQVCEEVLERHCETVQEEVCQEEDTRTREVCTVEMDEECGEVLEQVCSEDTRVECTTNNKEICTTVQEEVTTPRTDAAV